MQNVYGTLHQASKVPSCWGRGGLAVAVSQPVDSVEWQHDSKQKSLTKSVEDWVTTQWYEHH